jgi:hypothetical protein
VSLYQKCRIQLSQSVRYSSYDPDEPFGVPFHPPCFRVFAQVLRYQLSGEVTGLVDGGIVNKGILYTVMSGLHEEYDHCLKADYAELNDATKEQYWGCMPGQEVRLHFEGGRRHARYQTLRITGLGFESISNRESIGVLESIEGRQGCRIYPIPFHFKTFSLTTNSPKKPSDQSR